MCGRGGGGEESGMGLGETLITILKYGLSNNALHNIMTTIFVIKKKNLSHYLRTKH